MSLSKPNLLLAVFAVVRASACLNATLEEAGSSNRYAEFVADGESAVLSCGYRFTSDSLVPYLSDSATRNCTSFQSSVYCGAPDALPTVHYANWFFQNQTDKQVRDYESVLYEYSSFALATLRVHCSEVQYIQYNVLYWSTV